MKTKFFLIFSILFFTACNDGGLYGTVNPPMDGVVIEGEPNINVSGFEVATNPSFCGTAQNCFLTLANGSFGHLLLPLNTDFIKHNSRYGIRVKYGSTDLVYVYQLNGKNLERDNKNYSHGVIGDTTNDYNLLYFRNEMYEDILVRGIIPFGATAYHDENYIDIYMQLKKPIKQTETLLVCTGELDTTIKTTEKALIAPDCFSITIP